MKGALVSFIGNKCDLNLNQKIVNKQPKLAAVSILQKKHVPAYTHLCLCQDIHFMI